MANIMDKYTNFIGEQAKKYGETGQQKVNPDLPQTGLVRNTTVLPPNASQSKRIPIKS